jgi:CubicO group peptidase (beta-lactamase class C family)
MLPTLACVAWCASASAGADAQADLIARLEAIRIEERVPAIGLALASGEAVLWAGAFGTADVAGARPVAPDTLFRIGSVTKSFTAAAILLLEEEGRLRLDDPVHLHLDDPPYTNPWEATHPVRIAQLLEHTAGFADLSRAEFDSNDSTPLPLEAALARYRAEHVVHWPPGLHSEYSNVGAGLAGLVIERVSGERYEDFVAARLFAPLGMRDSGYFLDAEVRRRLATGYQADGRESIPYWHVVYRPFGGINSMPADMAAFVQLLINRGTYRGRRLLSAQSITRMEHPRTTLAAARGLAYGYGLANYQWSRRGHLFHGHGGDADGYLAHYGYNRDTGLGYFVVINAFNRGALARIRRVIELHLLRGRDAPEPPSAILPAATLARFCGLYEPVTRRFRWQDERASEAKLLEITHSGGRLYTRAPGAEPLPLIPVDDRRFRRASDAVATAAFVEHEGVLYLQGDMGNYRRR